MEVFYYFTIDASTKCQLREYLENVPKKPVNQDCIFIQLK